MIATEMIIPKMDNEAIAEPGVKCCGASFAPYYLRWVLGSAARVLVLRRAVG
jgi:hypothetical protein